MFTVVYVDTLGNEKTQKVNARFVRLKDGSLLLEDHYDRAIAAFSNWISVLKDEEPAHDINSIPADTK